MLKTTLAVLLGFSLLLGILQEKEDVSTNNSKNFKGVIVLEVVI